MLRSSFDNRVGIKNLHDVGYSVTVCDFSQPDNYPDNRRFPLAGYGYYEITDEAVTDDSVVMPASDM